MAEDSCQSASPCLSPYFTLISDSDFGDFGSEFSQSQVSFHQFSWWYLSGTLSHSTIRTRCLGPFSCWSLEMEMGKKSTKKKRSATVYFFGRLFEDPRSVSCNDYSASWLIVRHHRTTGLNPGRRMNEFCCQGVWCFAWSERQLYNATPDRCREAKA